MQILRRSSQKFIYFIVILGENFIINLNGHIGEFNLINGYLINY